LKHIHIARGQLWREKEQGQSRTVERALTFLKRTNPGKVNTSRYRTKDTD
jgi:hypothetical protein